MGIENKIIFFWGETHINKSSYQQPSNLLLYLFKSPNGIIDDLEKLRRGFLWGGDDSKEKIH